MSIKLLLIGTARQPTLNVGSNGLGRHTYDFLNQFQQKKDLNITTLLHKGSKLEWDSIRQLNYADEASDLMSIKEFISREKFDIIMDFSHHHLLSMKFFNENLPIINFIHDEECSYMPPNCMLGNECQKIKYTQGKVFITGIDVNKYKIFEKKQDYYSFCGKLERRKGYDIANHLAKKAKIKLIFAGPDVEGNAKYLDNWIGEIADHQKFCNFVGNSKALFYPSRADAGGIGILEAAALGTPTITTNQSGARCNVVNGVTGFIVNDEQEALQAINDVEKLDPCLIRKTCEEKWDFNKNFEKIYEQMLLFYKGERW